MSLRFTILGFLSTTPASGYELSHQFNQALGAWWHALPSQIYPELRRLEAEGLIEGEVSKENRLNKRIYRLTEKGDVELQAWIEGPIDYPPERDPERVQLILLDKSAPEVIRAHLLHHRAHYQERLSLWRQHFDAMMDGTHPRLQARLTGRAASEHGLIAGLKRIAVEGNMRRAELEIAWANSTLAWLDSLAAQQGDDKAPTQPARKAGKRRTARVAAATTR